LSVRGRRPPHAPSSCAPVYRSSSNSIPRTLLYNLLQLLPPFPHVPFLLPELTLLPDGTHSLSSPSHLSLLFSKTFNVSIPLQHIPLDEYIFEHTSREDQPDLEDESDISDSEDEDGFGGLGGFGLGTVHEVGRWKSVKDGKLLGEGGKGVKFTVIG
jgi:DNA-directed RNA polymerase I subunit RPA43